MKSSGESQYQLIVSDDGVGMPKDVDYPKKTSLGLQLIKSLTRQLGGTVDFQVDTGTTITICFNKPHGDVITRKEIIR